VYSSIFEHLEEGVLLVDIDTDIITYANKHAMSILGKKNKEIIGRLHKELYLPGEPKSELTKSDNGNEHKNYLSELIRKDGTTIPVHIRSVVINTDSRNYLLVFLYDISVLRAAEDTLRDTEERFRRLSDASFEGIAIHDKGVILDANRAYAEMFGYTTPEIIGKNVFELMAPEFRGSGLRTIKDGFDKPYEAVCVKKDGSKFVAEVCGKPCYFEKRTVRIVAIRDITERQRARKILQESEKRYRTLFEQSRDAIYISTVDGRSLDVNQSYLKLFGYTKEEMLAMNVREIYKNPNDRSRFQHDMEQNGSVTDWEVQMCKKDGTVMDCLLTSVTRLAEDGTILGYQGIIRDISARKQVENMLRESEEKLRIMFESIEEAVVAYTLDGQIVELNQMMLGLFHFENKDELLGQNIFNLIPLKNNIRGKRIALTGSKSLSGKHVEAKCVTKDCTKFDAELSTFVMKDKSGKPSGFITLIRDITELKQLRRNFQFYISQITRAQEEERKRVARELHDETIQELVSLAHEVQSINNYDNDEVHFDTVHQEQIRDKIFQIIAGVRRFCSELRPDVLDRSGLPSALELLIDELNRSRKINAKLDIIGLEQRLPPETELVLFRVAQEALSNVRKHSRAKNVIMMLEFAIDNVILTVKDDGMGFKPPKLLSDLAVKGRFGLNGIKERVRLVEGSLSIKSRVGKGTTLIVEVKKSR